MSEIVERAIALATETHLAASGPGGQNVNKVATAVQLRLDVFALGLPPQVYRRLKTLAGQRLTKDGELVLTARRYRTQEANRADARQRLTEMLEKAQETPKKRAKTRVNRVGKTKRLASKKAHGQKKALRGKVDL